MAGTVLVSARGGTDELDGDIDEGGEEFGDEVGENVGLFGGSGRRGHTRAWQGCLRRSAQDQSWSAVVLFPV